MKLKTFAITDPLFQMGNECEAVLRALPDWFGIEEAIVDYAREINVLPTFLIKQQEKIIGFVTIKIHFPCSAELFVLGILPEFHHKGLGKLAIEKVEDYCREKEIKFLQVKTLSPKRECQAYEKTRKFYLALGFQPLEEFTELWGEANPCLLMVKKV